MAALSASSTRDAKLAGIRLADADDGTKLSALARSRSHLAFALVAVVVGLALGTVLSSLRIDGDALIDPGILRIGLVGISVVFLVYAVEKERALRRLEGVLHAEQARHDAMTRETQRLHALINAGQALTSSLELERVVELALEGATNIFDAPAGAVFLDRGDLIIQAATKGSRHLDLADQQAHNVAETRQAALFPPRGPAPDGKGEHEIGTSTPAGMAAPLLHDGYLVGVLVLEADEDSPAYGTADLEILSRFAANVAAAIRHARALRAERATNERFAELSNVKAEFGWLSAQA